MLSGHHTLSVSSFTCMPEHICSSTYRSRLRQEIPEDRDQRDTIQLCLSPARSTVPKQGGKTGIVQGYIRDISSFFNVAFTSPVFGSGPTRAIAGDEHSSLAGPEHKGYPLYWRSEMLRTDFFYHISLIPVFGNLWPGTKHIANHSSISMCANKSYPLNAQAILA